MYRTVFVKLDILINKSLISRLDSGAEGACHDAVDEELVRSVRQRHNADRGEAAVAEEQPKVRHPIPS